MPDDLTPAAPEPLPLSPAGPAAAPWRRALLLALLVIAAGAALGTAAFAVEQRLFVWRPAVTAMPGGGWHVAGAEGQRPTSPAVAGSRVAWSQGGYTCLMDLASGGVKVIGAAPRGTELWSPALDDRTAVWMESPSGGAEDVTRLWVYDIARGRRVVYRVGAGAAAPVVAGDLVAWLDASPDGVPQVASLDLATGRRSAVVTGDATSLPVLAGEDVLGWLVDTGEGRPPSVVLRDLRTTTDTTVTLAAEGSGLTVSDVQLGGRTLLWMLRSADATRVVTFDLDAEVTEVVARGVVIESPATDGALVVWAQRDDASGSCIVRGRTLRGGVGGGPGAEFEIGRPPTWPTSLAAGGRWVVWSRDADTRSYLDAVKLPR